MKDYLWASCFFLIFSSIGASISAIIVTLVACSHPELPEICRFPTGRRWRRRLRYFLMAFLGALSASVAVTAATFLSQWWECVKFDRGCYDGQGGIVLIVLIPAAWAIGAISGFFWTVYTARINRENIYASIFLYNGKQKASNRIQAALVQIFFWVTIECVLFLGMLA